MGLEDSEGYPWYRQETGSEGIITYDTGHTSSPYTFMGDRGFLLNIEYHYRLSNLLRLGIFSKRLFLSLSSTKGKSGMYPTPRIPSIRKPSVGIGLQFGENDAVVVVNVPGLHSGRDDSVFRVNIAKALESDHGYPNNDCLASQFLVPDDGIKCMRIILILTILVMMSVPAVLLEGDSDLFTFVRLKYSGAIYAAQ